MQKMKSWKSLNIMWGIRKDKREKRARENTRAFVRPHAPHAWVQLTTTTRTLLPNKIHA